MAKFTLNSGNPYATSGGNAARNRICIHHRCTQLCQKGGNGRFTTADTTCQTNALAHLSHLQTYRTQNGLRPKHHRGEACTC